MLTTLVLVGIALGTASRGGAAAEPAWRVGLARVKITPGVEEFVVAQVRDLARKTRGTLHPGGPKPPAAP